MDILYLQDPNWKAPSKKEIKQLYSLTRESKMRKMNWDKIKDERLNFLPSSSEKSWIRRGERTNNLNGRD